MATEIVHLCDWHLSDDGSPRVFASHAHVVTLDGAEFTMDLCDECQTKRFDPLAAFVTIHGVRTKPAPRQRPRDRDHRHPDDDGSLTCPVCGFNASNRTGLGAHGFHGHGMRGIAALYALAAEQRA